MSDKSLLIGELVSFASCIDGKSGLTSLGCGLIGSACGSGGGDLAAVFAKDCEAGGGGILTADGVEVSYGLYTRLQRENRAVTYMIPATCL